MNLICYNNGETRNVATLCNHCKGDCMCPGVRIGSINDRPGCDGGICTCPPTEKEVPSIMNAADLSLIYSALRIAKEHWDKLHNAPGNFKEGCAHLTHVFHVKAKEAEVLREKVRELFVTMKS